MGKNFQNNTALWIESDANDSGKVPLVQWVCWLVRCWGFQMSKYSWFIWIVLKFSWKFAELWGTIERRAKLTYFYLLLILFRNISDCGKCLVCTLERQIVGSLYILYKIFHNERLGKLLRWTWIPIPTGSTSIEIEYRSKHAIFQKTERLCSLRKLDLLRWLSVAGCAWRVNNYRYKVHGSCYLRWNEPNMVVIESEEGNENRK